MTIKDWDGRLPGYPAAAVRRYRDAGLWGDRTIAEEFHAVALRYPGREAIVSQEGRMTFAGLDRRTDQVAAGLVTSAWGRVTRSCSRSATGCTPSWPGTGPSRPA